jgi:hypothetical protein
MKEPLDELRESAVWSALQRMLAEMVATKEITLNTAPDYVVSYICQELRAKGLVTEAGLRPRQ